MSPWASPIVIVPKKTSPGEPPRRQMCVDYQMVNSLAPPVVKAHCCEWTVQRPSDKLGNINQGSVCNIYGCQKTKGVYTGH